MEHSGPDFDRLIIADLEIRQALGAKLTEREEAYLLASRYKRLRKEAGATLEGMCYLCSLPAATVRSIENPNLVNGNFLPQINELLKIVVSVHSLSRYGYAYVIQKLNEEGYKAYPYPLARGGLTDGATGTNQS